MVQMMTAHAEKSNKNTLYLSYSTYTVKCELYVYSIVHTVVRTIHNIKEDVEFCPTVRVASVGVDTFLFLTTVRHYYLVSILSTTTQSGIIQTTRPREYRILTRCQWSRERNARHHVISIFLKHHPPRTSA
jgi:hypothetical protein